MARSLNVNLPPLMQSRPWGFHSFGVHPGQETSGVPVRLEIGASDAISAISVLLSLCELDISYSFREVLVGSEFGSGNMGVAG
jgi:hypothetical protein